MSLSLPDIMLYGLARSSHIPFNFAFPSLRDGLLSSAQKQSSLTLYLESAEILWFTRCGVVEISRALAERPVKRYIEICWFDDGVAGSRESKKRLVRPFSRPFSRLQSLCTFILGKVIDEEERNLAWHALEIRGELRTSSRPFTNQIEERDTRELKPVRVNFATHEASNTNTSHEYILIALQGPAP